MKLHQSPAGASPLRIPTAPPQPPAGPSEADQKFAEVIELFICWINMFLYAAFPAGFLCLDSEV